MFVSRCRVDHTEELRYAPEQAISKKAKKKKGKKAASSQQEPETELSEAYRPVYCEVCNTQVAVYDKDEVFHFFNVLASH